MSFFLSELCTLAALPLCLPFPGDRRLIGQCQQFLAHPDTQTTIDDWCQRLNMSRRTFTRLFNKETGMSFSTWRQQACVFAALPRLAAGEPVTLIAMEMGYDSVSAFTAMFKRLIGVSPRRYIDPAGGPSGAGAPVAPDDA